MAAVLRAHKLTIFKSVSRRCETGALDWLRSRIYWNLLFLRLPVFCYILFLSFIAEFQF